MRRLLALIREAYTLRHTERELRALSDHLLRDLGLRRDQLNREFLRKQTGYKAIRF